MRPGPGETSRDRPSNSAGAGDGVAPQAASNPVWGTESLSVYVTVLRVGQSKRPPCREMLVGQALSFPFLWALGATISSSAVP